MVAPTEGLECHGVVMDYSHETQISTLSSLPGGSALITRCEDNVSFHDAEVQSIHLPVHEPCVLRVLNWPLEASIKAGRGVRPFVATLVMTDVMDLELDGFSARQNVLFTLMFRRSAGREDRREWFTLKPLPDDIEIELDPSVGIGGYIRCRELSITYEDIDEDDSANRFVSGLKWRGQPRQ
jgi:hypothetical protein